ncbi:unnamed protein product [Rotaria sordida]|uniref:Uncharacterized protein n=1 Tax=Rotaria sordida TaxID=392033 RepID=A0A819QDT4_9BILA|nr:unnamed protein product [Rotaria sordida]CAF4026933.1 unnamed protein product [Rotaria sordida]CAF4026941.1 unnamed protein product [Rotaria sordida]
MGRISNSIHNEINDRTESPSPPPPYNWVVYKINENEFDRIQSSTHFDVNNQSFIDFNNYSGPPLADGHIQVDENNLLTNHDNIIPKKIRIYLILNGIITIIFGLISIGIQISLIASNLILYYYYGFWGGLFLIIIGLNTSALYSYHRRIYYSKFFRSFLWQSIFVGILLALGIIIILTDTCNDNTIKNDDGNHLCKHSYKILNRFLLGTFALIFLQAIVNGIIFFILKR